MPTPSGWKFTHCLRLQHKPPFNTQEQFLPSLVLPEIVVSNNEPTFISRESKNFLCQNGIKYVMSALYHPDTNGLVERAVVQVQRWGEEVEERWHADETSKFLVYLSYNTANTTGVLPAEILMGRRLRSALDLVKQDIHKRVEWGQEQQKAACDQHTVIHSFKVGDQEYAQNSHPEFPHHEESSEDTETTTSDSIPAKMKIWVEHVVTWYRIVNLRTDTPE